VRSAILTIGVNAGPRSTVLSFAEKDAEDVAGFFASDLAVPGAATLTLRGSGASRSAVSNAVAALYPYSPDQLVFYFSGHGGNRGLLLSDGLLEHDELAHLLKPLAGTKKIIVLDACRAGSYLVSHSRVVVGALPEARRMEPHRAWYELLARAVPRSRILLGASADRNTIEDARLGNGLFTHALLEALRYGAGTLEHGGHAFVSDADVADHVTRSMKQHGAGQHRPEWSGIAGDMPMARSQSTTAIGRASVVEVQLRRLNEALVVVSTQGRRGVPTIVRIAVRGATWVLDEREVRFQPADSIAIDPVAISLDGRRVASALERNAALLREFAISVAVSDEFGRELARRVVRFVNPFAYGSASSW